MLELTTVIDVQQTHDWRPDKDQCHTRPASIERRSATSNGKDVVTIRLYHIVDNHEVNRTSKTQKKVHDKSSAALPFARCQDCPVCVQNHSQVTHNTCQ